MSRNQYITNQSQRMLCIDKIEWFRFFAQCSLLRSSAKFLIVILNDTCFILRRLPALVGPHMNNAMPFERTIK